MTLAYFGVFLCFMGIFIHDRNGSHCSRIIVIVAKAFYNPHNDTCSLSKAPLFTVAL